MPDREDGTQPVGQGSRERIVVSGSLISPHPLVAAALEQLKAAKLGPDKMVRTDPATAADAHVRPETADRALRILDAFAKAWEREGGYIGPGTCGGSPCTVLAIENDAVAIRMVETTTPPGRGRRPAGAPAPAAVPRLGFVVGEGRLEGLKGLWAETTTIRLEKMLRPLIDATRRYLEAQRQVRLDRECEERQRKKAESVRQAKTDEADEAFCLRQQLIQDADRWHQGQKVRAYLAAMEKRIEAGEICPTDPERFREWMDWAKWFADDMDPMVQVPPRGKPPTVAKNTPVDELDLTSQARKLISKLGVKDTEELLLVPHDTVRTLTGWNSHVWQELTLVLEGLGYDVTKRNSVSRW